MDFLVFVCRLFVYARELSTCNHIMTPMVETLQTFGNASHSFANSASPFVTKHWIHNDITNTTFLALMLMK